MARALVELKNRINGLTIDEIKNICIELKDKHNADEDLIVELSLNRLEKELNENDFIEFCKTL